MKIDHTADCMYAEVTRSIAAEPNITSGIQLLALDEWYGIPSDHPATCSSFNRQNVSRPWLISEDRMALFDSTSDNPESECRRINGLLEKNGKAPGILCCVRQRSLDSTVRSQRIFMLINLHAVPFAKL